MTSHHATGVLRYAPLVARLLISGMFIMAGVTKFFDLAGTAGFIESVGLPMGMALAVLAAALELIAGIAILVGFQGRLAAWLLVGFTLVATAIFHSDFADQVQMLFFTKNMAIVGGLLLIAVHGTGPLSVGCKCGGAKCLECRSGDCSKSKDGTNEERVA